jgi:hypothetical protein
MEQRMAVDREYADTLRALGRFLDDVGASEIGIVERGEDVLVTWSGQGRLRHERHLREVDLQAMRTSARMFRGLGGPSPRFTLSELLRTLGDILDELAPGGVSITESADGFRLSMLINGERVVRTYSYSALVARSQQHHRQRRNTPG